MLGMPEFHNSERIRHMIEFLESGEAVVSTLEQALKSGQGDQVVIRIGSENSFQDLSEYSVVTRKYRVGHVTGTIGLIGPTRMNYARAVGLVDAMAATINSYLV
jgi:heat-inducible transcriptional repressor